MAWLSHHPAPGFGDLITGFFVVPQNPIVDNKSRALMPYGFAGYGQVGYVPRFGDLMPSRLAVPSNPLIRALRAGMSGCCCGGDEGEGSGGAAVGDTDTGYVNGQPVLGGSFVDSMDWASLAIGAGAAALLLSMAKK